MTNFFSAMYPDTNTLSDAGLENAHRYLINKVRLDADHDCFKCGFSKGDYVEALAVVIIEQDYRWENGGRAARQAQLNAQFGELAVTLK